jgi:hypothetical protein
VKTLLASALTLAAVLATTPFASAQVVPSIQESGDVFRDIVRLSHSDSSSTLSSPFNMGFVQSPTSNLISAIFSNYNEGSDSSPDYSTSMYEGLEYDTNSSYNSQIFLNFCNNRTPIASPTFNAPVNTFTMYAADVLPCVEAKLPKGTYTFHATATPTVGTSTPGTFEFETETTGVWTVQFNLALPKPEGATRTLTFAHDTRVRWMLINNQGTTACAAITAKYYNSGS